MRDLRLLISLRSDFPDDAHRAWILRRSAQDLLLFVRFRKGIVRPFKEPEYFDIVAREVQGALDADLKRPFFLDNNIGGGQLLIEIQLHDGDVMDVLVPHVRLTFGSSFAYVLAQVGLALVLFGLAIWFMRRELVPIEHLGVAADALGKGRDVPDFAFSGGTREVRNAATAFHTMRIRLRRSIQQRTEMLAGVSHDLRTPLTRMKLSLAHAAGLAGDQGAGRRRRRHAAHDRGLSRLRARRGRRGSGRRRPLRDPARMSRPARGATMPNLDVALAGRHERRAAPDRHQALPDQPRVQRAALRQPGQDRRPCAAAPSVEITVDDDGPGIPPDRHEDVFRPFLRLDESRNADTGGVGPRPHHRPRRGAQPRRRRHARPPRRWAVCAWSCEFRCERAPGLAARPPVIE